MNTLEVNANSKATVEKLIRGAIEISRMQKEIRVIINMVILNLYANELRQCLIDRQYDRLACYSLNCKWEVSTDPQMGIMIHCYKVLRQRDGILTSGERILGGSAHGSSFDAKDTELIHRNLPILIEWIFKAYPQITERLKPFLEVG